MKVLITGISGSGASYLAEYIVNNHPEVELHGTFRSNSSRSQKNIQEIANKLFLHDCDLDDYTVTHQLIAGLKPDIVFHIASYANVRESWDKPVFTLQNNIISTANLLEAIRSAAGIHPRIQMCSTPEVYGQVDPKNIPIDESCPINPNNPYAVSKFAQESLGYSYFKGFGLPVIITRMSTYLNPRRADLFATAFAMQVARIEAGLQKELRHGNLDSTRTILDPRDCASAYWAAIEKGESGEVYNIGGNTVVTVGEFLEVLKIKARRTIPSIADKSLFRPADITLQIINSGKFSKQTGWQPKYSFEESVEYLLGHCRRTVQEELASR
ncbi:MAG: hypothetical protein A3G51_02615 [Candidatus Yanofskybacteria bacterium RIFCSPLOWO2_12_FULL_43_11b]|uniref:NAD(P)-binding domain-containing protein n=1 Tax=Candidatus Yanofskybacteria bacterium RIFCSPLOWO2_12_FULL_43_11b TaxID=1802710 RepID=A0A1F8H8T2_9BACT|nr:MAG: hypothetical protein A2742_00255 [Candidatus Yanofskybacteria bacterium RIFCSPHIGHO2_01_FULL_43_32]OGN11032.1 MAG: hypothetical protein A3C69_03395 [Candidatus Yanofskybacteria bacterium RIFCSPHIGHO2_02_FULL_43_12]OGN24230.1 MAG: hypothetical protein A2923_02195 [Candidatus Yanofskybacteria bacterium RIFCSPLOWO2_01_FULL_43_46]OGN33600.1 MAG: hypothetical protein A3G51_02615 [Candidatus Yanofskybacteria bacterium RIFCSPLOWO2_12_FULL_43_11b]